MVIHELDAATPLELQRAIGEFEATFLLPLAPGRFFRIDYGSDRAAFIRSLGESKCLVAEKEGRVVGVLEMASVKLLLPDGTSRSAVYIADIKLAPDARATILAGRLLQRAAAWGVTKSDLYFSVALDGMTLKPPDYTGRAGIAAFSEAGRIVVVRLPVTAGAGIRAEDERFLARYEDGATIHRRLSHGRYWILGGSPQARSETPPTWLVHPGGLACARFEDRRKVRRLIADDGSELRPAYLACFAFQDPQAAADLIAAALRRAESLGFRALRFCLPPDDLAKLQRVTGAKSIEGSGGTVFATAAAKAGALWNLNAAEI